MSCFLPIIYMALAIFFLLLPLMLVVFISWFMYFMGFWLFTVSLFNCLLNEAYSYHIPFFKISNVWDGFLGFPLSHEDGKFNYVINFCLVAHPQQSPGCISDPVLEECSLYFSSMCDVEVILNLLTSSPLLTIPSLILIEQLVTLCLYDEGLLLLLSRQIFLGFPVSFNIFCPIYSLE